MGLTHYMLTVSTGVVAGMLVSLFWIWQAPQPTVVNQLDAKEVAEFLAPAIAAMKPSKGK